MIPLIVFATSGCYRVPGAVPTGLTASTYPIAPPATVRGFIESLCGKEKGTFRGHFAYGWHKHPEGRGEEMKSLAMWTSSGEVTRPVRTPFLYRPTYQVVIDSPVFEDLIQKSLLGEITRYGVLYLGESEDTVLRIEVKQEAAEWLVPGAKYILPVRSKYGYGYVNPTLGRFALTERQDVVPEKAWLS